MNDLARLSENITAIRGIINSAYADGYIRRDKREELMRFVTSMGQQAMQVMRQEAVAEAQGEILAAAVDWTLRGRHGA